MSVWNDFAESLRAMGQAFYYFWWLVLPITLFYIFKIIWFDFVLDKSKFSWLKSLDWILLEVIPPRDYEKSPKVMETFFIGLSGVITTHNQLDVWTKGAILDRFGVELVGEEGKVHFFIRSLRKHRNMVEAHIYSMYPEAEIVEVEDYTKKFPRVIPNRDWDLWGTDMELQKPDPYPIKTYDKFEETISGTMIDPIAALTEVIGTLGPGQHIWLQYVLDPLPEKLWAEENKIVQELAGRKASETKGILSHFWEVIASVPKAFFTPVEFAGEEKKEQQPLEFRLTPGEKELLKAVEDNLGKNAFKVKMRFIYLSRKEVFDKAKVSAFIGALKQFNDQNFNSFKPNDISKTYANYLFKKERLAYRQRLVYLRYKFRSMDDAKFVLSTKELATVFHFPDIGVKAPSITKVEAKRGTAPSNLPIE